MPGIEIPVNRTIKQRAVGYCKNPECKIAGQDFQFTVENDLFACPKCGCNNPAVVGLYVLIHLLLSDPVNGKIDGSDGRRWSLACDEDRAYIAVTNPSLGWNLEQATGDPSATNCRQCLAEAQLRKAVRNGYDLTLTK